MLPQEIIRRKRDKAELDTAEIRAMIGGIADGSIGEGQIGAFAMAVCLNGMTMAERVALTRAMADTGETLSWRREELGREFGRPILDKHSTGGVGDKVSLILAPVIAACGGYVPMISGRGLGHTGGTLDKLDSIPGYETAPTIERFRKAVADVGCAIIGQTAELAPADRRLYAVRDVTATVESIPLITASILSKKLAAGLDVLVLDVKTGTGAFAGDESEARDLAESIVTVAAAAGLRTCALITDMNQVLGRTAGNAVEVVEAVDFLTGRSRDPRLQAVTLGLAAEMLVLGGLAASLAEASERAQAALDDGGAAERFARMVAALGGPGDLLERSGMHHPRAPVVVPCFPKTAGAISAVDAREIGLAVVELGGGRTRSDDAIDHSVGLTRVAAIGEAVGPDRPIAMIHARDEADADRAAGRLRAAITIGDRGEAGPVIRERIGTGG